jgi:arginyl-tRNA--protein-N-Asp/Glu arginylyltransferase
MQDLIATEYHAEPSSEQFRLFRRYLDSRHQSGGMADMSIGDYAMMVEDTHVDSRIIEYRIKAPRATDCRSIPPARCSVWR